MDEKQRRRSPGVSDKEVKVERSRVNFRNREKEIKPEESPKIIGVDLAKPESDSTAISTSEYLPNDAIDALRLAGAAMPSRSILDSFLNVFHNTNTRREGGISINPSVQIPRQVPPGPSRFTAPRERMTNFMVSLAPPVAYDVRIPQERLEDITWPGGSDNRDLIRSYIAETNNYHQRPTLNGFQIVTTSEESVEVERDMRTREVLVCYSPSTQLITIEGTGKPLKLMAMAMHQYTHSTAVEEGVRTVLRREYGGTYTVTRVVNVAVGDSARFVAVCDMSSGRMKMLALLNEDVTSVTATRAFAPGQDNGYETALAGLLSFLSSMS